MLKFNNAMMKDGLNTPHKVFSGNTPFAMLVSRFGTELVMEELGRIEYGVYS